MMYGGKYMNNDDNGSEDDDEMEYAKETMKYNKYGCAGPSTTLEQIMATDKKGK